MMLENRFRSILALFSYLIPAIIGQFPAAKARRAISTVVTIALIIIIVVAGVAIIVVLVISPGPSTTTYP
jgi:hypothetical protein